MIYLFKKLFNKKIKIVLNKNNRNNLIIKKCFKIIEQIYKIVILCSKFYYISKLFIFIYSKLIGNNKMILS
jgi:hypothetical protein